MNDYDKKVIKNFIAKKRPQHLNGFKNGWLHYIYLYHFNKKIIHIYPEEDEEKEFLGSVFI